MAGLGPVFLLQVVKVEPPHEVVVSRFQAGGILQANLISAVITAAKARGIGIGKTEAQVATAIDAAIRDVFTHLTEQTRGMVPAFKAAKR